MKKNGLLASLITFVILFALMFYFTLPAINIQSAQFLFLLVVILGVSSLPIISQTTRSFFTPGQFPKQFDLKLPTKFMGFFFALILIPIIGGVVFSPIFLSSRYADRINVTDGNFSQDIAEVDLNNLPLLDKDSTQRVGDRVMGQLPELISQFEVSPEYTQISYQGRLVRVTPLEYNGFFKWFGNKNVGSPGYILVDSTTGEASLVKLNQGMKYLSSAFFNNNLERHIRFQFPTEILTTSVFEIDDEGTPYFVTPVLSVQWIDTLPDVKGVITTNPITGESTYYANGEVPAWVDHVFPSQLILEQINDWGSYQNGWLNSFISQKNVRQTTQGYTYISDGQDTYIYTGITSAAADESNIGFILTNLRTKDTRFYAVPGAEEFSAMNSAEGAVQEKRYSATFPLLVNLNNRPTYLTSLKDDAGLVKAYAFVDVQDYQKVKVTDSNLGLANAANSYLAMIGNEVEVAQESSELSGVIESIESVVIDGNSYFYLTLEKETTIFKAPIGLDDRLPFLSVGSTISFTHNNGNILSISSIQSPQKTNELEEKTEDPSTTE